MNLDLAHQFQFYIGTFERETYRWIRHLSQGINSAIDIGSADGEYSLFFLARTKANTVYAFEPIAECRERLFHNLEINRLNDSVRFVLSGKMVGIKNDEQFCTLDELLPKLQFPYFIKMDVDGGETDVLEGAFSLLHDKKVRWLIETHSILLERECLNILEKAGFRTRIIRNAWWRCIVPEQRVSEINRWLVAARPEDIDVAR